ncbi:hypothetical protein BCF44_1492 [Kutzneria buriramensis]|uniref:Uncharacterized protein n=1 Tax=Kutzneria buriramensis TaxID=1045776 RepID=A0A3E0G3U6_9PSEU|nr:hypothetical protein BCF44_1492 [Kutzneria buriramensis]
MQQTPGKERRNNGFIRCHSRRDRGLDPRADRQMRGLGIHPVEPVDRFSGHISQRLMNTAESPADQPLITRGRARQFLPLNPAQQRKRNSINLSDDVTLPSWHRWARGDPSSLNMTGESETTHEGTARAPRDGLVDPTLTGRGDQPRHRVHATVMRLHRRLSDTPVVRQTRPQLPLTNHPLKSSSDGRNWRPTFVTSPRARQTADQAPAAAIRRSNRYRIFAITCPSHGNRTWRELRGLWVPKTTSIKVSRQADRRKPHQSGLIGLQEQERNRATYLPQRRQSPIIRRQQTHTAQQILYFRWSSLQERGHDRPAQAGHHGQCRLVHHPAGTMSTSRRCPQHPASRTAHGNRAPATATASTSRCLPADADRSRTGDVGDPVARDLIATHGEQRGWSRPGIDRTERVVYLHGPVSVPQVRPGYDLTSRIHVPIQTLRQLCTRLLGAAAQSTTLWAR